MPASPGLGWDPEMSAIEMHLVGTQRSAPTDMLGDCWYEHVQGTIILFSVLALGLRAYRASLTAMTRAKSLVA